MEKGRDEERVCFVFWDPHSIHKTWAESVDAKPYSFVPFNSSGISKIIKSNGVLLHFFAILKSLFFLPEADVYLMESPMMITALFFKTLFSNKKKVFAIVSDPFFFVFNDFNSPTRYIFKLLIKRIDGYFATSDMMAKYISKIVRDPKYEITTPYIAPSYLKINADLSSKNACFIGPHLNEQKGVDLLIDSFSVLPNQEQRQLYLIGDAQQKIIEKKQSEKVNIRITGRVPDPGIYLQKCGLYLNLARLEPAGSNILEAMAAGIPPIVSDMCGLAPEVRRIDRRLIVSATNKKQIIKAVDWLENTADRNLLSKKAKAIARSFTKENSIVDFRNKFNKLNRAVSI